MPNAWDAVHRVREWVFQEKHKQKAHALRQEIEKAFTDHPTETGETYLQHLLFTLEIGIRFLFVGLAILAHGLFPFLFTRAASTQIERVSLILKSRIPKFRRGESSEHYDI